MNAPVLVFLQWDKGSPLPGCLEILGQAKLLSHKIGAPLYGLMIGAPDDLQGFKGISLDGLYIYGDGALLFDGPVWGNAITTCLTELDPDIFLLAATPEGRALAPYAAAKIGTGLTADCVELTIDDGLLVQTRPAFEGNRMACVVTPSARPQMATVRSGIFPIPERNGHGLPPIYRRPLLCTDSALEFRAFRPDTRRHPLQGQKILVAVGGGVKRQEDLALFESLAQRLGGSLACSRILVERGWLPPERQIGLSGTAVNTNVLLAFGISGSIQFRSGIQNVCKLIAVNSDPGASIFSMADHGFVCDMYEVVHAMLNS